MGIIVQKFGGSSMADKARIENVADIVTSGYQEGNQMVVVVSAQGDTTDDLIEKAKEINPQPTKREMDVLLSVGEQISISLLAMAIQKRGFPVVSLTGWQAGIRTDSHYGSALIKKIQPERIRAELDNQKIVIVAGFQGVNKKDDITTLGRGGSDTTAVSLAAVLYAERCQIFTDVDGIYTADPRLVKDARKLDQITYDEMLELAHQGAQVLHNRSVEMAKRYRVNLEVLSSFTRNSGTIVKEVTDVEKTYVSGVAKDNNVAVISLHDLNDVPGIAFRIFSLFAHRQISVDMILQASGRDGKQDISFTVAETDADDAVPVLEKIKEEIKFHEYTIDKDVAKVSIVGAGMTHNHGVAAAMFEAIYNAGINVRMISTSEITITVIVDKDNAEKAMQAVHNRFFN